MALSRNSARLLLLSCPAVVYLAASLEDVNASSQCLSSAEAVRREYPGSWPSWTTHAPDHKGTKCWFPAMRENHSRHIETLLRKTAEVQAKEVQAKEVQAKEVQAKEASAKEASVKEASVKEASVKEAPANKSPVERRQRSEAAVNNKPAQDTPLASANEMNELGWSFRSRTTKVGPVRIFDEFAEVESSFDDRFAAALDVSSVRQPSVIQRMMDPVGAIP
jgi:hypothetical protein